MLVHAYGEYWLASEVDWGKSGKQGHLWGYSSKKSKPVDHWEQRGIYVLFQGFTPVYVGQTLHQPLGQRLRHHWNSIDKRGRWDRFSWYGVRDTSETSSQTDKTHYN